MAVDEVLHNGVARGVAARTLAVELELSYSGADKARHVEVGGNGRLDRAGGHERRHHGHGVPAAFGAAVRHELHGEAELLGRAHNGKPEPADAECGNVRAAAAPERDARGDDGLVPHVDAVDVRRGVRLGVPERLRIGQDLGEVRALAVHAVEDVVARPVQYAREGLDGVDARRADEIGDPGNAPAHARLDVEMGAARLRRGGELVDMLGHDRLVGRDNVLARLEGSENIRARGLDAAHDLDDGVDRGIGCDVLERVRHARFVALARTAKDSRHLDRPCAACLDDPAHRAPDRTVPEKCDPHMVPIFCAPRPPAAETRLPIIACTGARRTAGA